MPSYRAALLNKLVPLQLGLEAFIRILSNSEEEIREEEIEAVLVTLSDALDLCLNR
jgi:hypothetical protein